MRYTITSIDTEGLVGIQLDKWAKEGKVHIIEKSETLVEIEARLDRVHSALQILKKAGYNSEVMEIFIKEKTKLPMRDIKDVLDKQFEFLKKIGALK